MALNTNKSPAVTTSTLEKSGIPPVMFLLQDVSAVCEEILNIDTYIMILGIFWIEEHRNVASGGLRT